MLSKTSRGASRLSGTSWAVSHRTNLLRQTDLMSSSSQERTLPQLENAFQAEKCEKNAYACVQPGCNNEEPSGTLNHRSPLSPFSIGHSFHQNFEIRPRKGQASPSGKPPRKATINEHHARQDDQRTTAAQRTKPKRQTEDRRHKRQGERHQQKQDCGSPHSQRASNSLPSSTAVGRKREERVRR